ncbi:MAG TPA: hypothetical protein VF995_00860 [Actinomycetota bacterium]
MRRSQWRRRLVLAPLLAVVLAMAGATPASAHVIGTSAKPGNYRTRVLAINPAVPGLTVRVVEAGGKLELINHSGQAVLVLGYDNEPYLRVGPSGVDENERSPSTWSNRSVLPPKTRPPSGLDPSAPPRWRRVSGRPVAIWHDHRSHWAGPGEPPAVRADRGRTQVVVPEWRVPLRVGSQTVVVSGEIAWVPGPAPWPWIGAAVLLCAAVLLAARRGGAWRLRALIAATVLAVAADVVHATGSWLGSTASTVTKLYSNATPLAGWVVAGLAIWRLLRGRTANGSGSPDALETGNTYLLIAGIFLAVAGALPDVGVLDSSQIPEPFPPNLTRAVVTITLGLGSALVLAVLLAPPTTPRRPKPAPDPSGNQAAPSPSPPQPS